MRLVTIASYTHPYQAHMAADLLRDAGIACFLRDELLVTMNLYYSNAVGGVKLVIPEDAVDEAMQILSAITEPGEVAIEEGMPEGDEVVCPECGAEDALLERRSGFLPVITFFALGFPFAIPRDSYRCAKCGKRWMEEREQP